MLYENGQGLRQDYKQAGKWYRRAGNRINVVAHCAFVDLYATVQGLGANPMQAVRRLRDAAARGDAIAQEQLGTMYYYGVAVEEDYKKAAEWYRRAANQGSAKAQTNLGALYRDGLGVAQSYHKAARWFREATRRGNQRARWAFARLYEDGGYRNVRDYEVIFAYYLEAAEEGNPDAQISVGDFYYSGKGIKKNYREARKWYLKAMLQGNEKAARRVATLDAEVRKEERRNFDMQRRSGNLQTLPPTSNLLTSPESKPDG